MQFPRRPLTVESFEERALPSVSYYSFPGFEPSARMALTLPSRSFGGESAMYLVWARGYGGEGMWYRIRVDFVPAWSKPTVPDVVTPAPVTPSNPPVVDTGSSSLAATAAAQTASSAGTAAARAAAANPAAVQSATRGQAASVSLAVDNNRNSAGQTSSERDDVAAAGRAQAAQDPSAVLASASVFGGRIQYTTYYGPAADVVVDPEKGPIPTPKEALPPADDDVAVVQATAPAEEVPAPVAQPTSGVLPLDLTALSASAANFLGRVSDLAVEWPTGVAEVEDYLWTGAAVLLAGAAIHTSTCARPTRAPRGPAGADSVLAEWEGKNARRAVDGLLDQLARGDAAAAGTLFAAYAPYLELVRRQLSDHLRAKFDSADVVQSVWVQVVRQLGRDGWTVDDEARLRALLATIARRRLLTRVRRLAGDPTTNASPNADLPDPSPRPSQVAQATDLWDRLLVLCPAEHRPVLLLRREGLPLVEIAARTGLHEGSVRRILRRLSRELALREEPLASNLAGAEK